MKNKWLSLLLVFAMVMSLIPAYGTKAAEGDPTVELGNPRYVEGSTTEVYFPDVTLSNSTNIKTVLVSVNVGAINVEKETQTHTMSDREVDGTHKTYAWINETGWDVSTVQKLLESLTFTYTDDLYVNVTVDSNEVKGEYNQTGVYITSNNIREANGHYYMYVPYDASEEKIKIDETKAGHAEVNDNYSKSSWTQAYGQSKAYTFMGMKGYLATITSEDEAKLLYSINDKAGWCGGTLLTYTNDRKITNIDEIVDGLKIPNGPNAPIANEAEHNRTYYYWACGPEGEVGQPVKNELWNGSEPNFNKNDGNPSIVKYSLNSDSDLDLYESCVIANYECNPNLNDIKAGNYSDPNAGTENPDTKVIRKAGRAFGYFVEFGGFTDEENKAKVNKAFQSKPVVRLAVNTQADNGAFIDVVNSVWPGEEVTATVTANTGYKLPDSITVTVGGKTLTADQYTWDKTTGKVVITAKDVTGNVVIDVDCIPVNVNVKVTVDNGLANQNNVTIEENVDKTVSTNSDYTLKILPEEDYTLPENITVTVGGQTLVEGTDYTYDKSTGEVKIESGKITGDVVIDADCIPEPANATVSVGNGTVTQNGTTVEENKAQTINKKESYTATINPEEGYRLPESITVTVGGKTLVEGTDYTYDKTTGLVNIDASKVTGDVVINADCIPKNVNVTVSVDNGTATKDNAVVEEDKAQTMNTDADYIVTVSPESGYNLPESVTVVVGDKTLVEGTDYTYDKTTGKVTIPKDKLTGDVKVKADCDKDSYKATGKVTNGSYSGAATATPGKDYTATIKPNDGYELPDEITVKVDGKEVDSSDYEWDPETGKVTVPGGAITGDVEITAKCEEKTVDVVDDVTNGTFDGPETAEPGEDYTATITPDDGYELPDKITVKVDGDKLDSSDYDWDSETGEVTIDGDKVTGDIEISVTCKKVGSDGNPATGDNSNVWFYFMIMLLSLVGVAGCTAYKVKTK